MERIGIIAAMAPEMEMIRDSIENCTEVKECGIEFFVGTIMNHEVVLSRCGVGKVNAAMAATMLISSFECTLIINSGIAGGLEPLKPRDVIVANALMYHDFDVKIFGYPYGQVPEMPREFLVNPELLAMVRSTLNKLKIDYKIRKILSGDQFVTSADALKNVEVYDNVATEMEGAAIAHVCVKSGVDFLVIRFISDVIGEPSQIDNYQEFEQEMATKSAAITLQLISNL